VSYHDREYDGSDSGLEDPEQSQAEDLQEGEEVDLSEGNVSKVNQVRLMFGWHQKQFETIHKLDTQGTNTTMGSILCLKRAYDTLDLNKWKVT